MTKISRSDSENRFPQNTSISSDKPIKGQAKVKQARGKDEKMSTLAKQSLESSQESSIQLKGKKRVDKAVRSQPAERLPSENRELFYNPYAQKELKGIVNNLFELIEDLQQLEFVGKNVTSSFQDSLKNLEFDVGEWCLDTQDELSSERRRLLLRFEDIGVDEKEEVAWLIRGLEEWGHKLETSLDRMIIQIGQLEPLSNVRKELESFASFLKKELFLLEKGIVALNIPKTSAMEPPSSGWTKLAKKHHVEENQPGTGQRLVNALLVGMTLMQQAITTSQSIDAGVRQHGWRPNFAQVHETDISVEHQVTRIDSELISSMLKGDLEKTGLATRELLSQNTPSRVQPVGTPNQDRVNELEDKLNHLRYCSTNVRERYVSNNIIEALKSGDLFFLQFISSHPDTRDLFLENIDKALNFAYHNPSSSEVINFLHQFTSYSQATRRGLHYSPALDCRVQYSAAKCLEFFGKDWNSDRILMIKNLGHSWEVSGIVDSINMESFFSPIFEAEFQSYITQFHMDHGELIRDQELQLVINALNRNPIEQYETPIEHLSKEAIDKHRMFTEGKPVFIHTGFISRGGGGHAIDVLLFGDFLVVANKSGSLVPLEVFKITKEDMKPSDIETIINLIKNDKSEYQKWLSATRARYSQDELSRYIENRYPFEREQSVGNCSWESLETALYAMFLINSIDEPDRVDRMFDLLMQSIKVATLNAFIDNMVQPAYNRMKNAKQESDLIKAREVYKSCLDGLKAVLDKSLSMKWDNTYQEKFNMVREKAIQYLNADTFETVYSIYSHTYSISHLFRSIFG